MSDTLTTRRQAAAALIWNRPRLRFITEAPEGAAPEQPADPKPEAPAQETDWKAEARKWEQRAKDNSKAAEKLAALEESQKTEQQKLQERAEAAEQALAASEREASRLTVIAAKGIPAEYQHLIRGDSADELNAAADAVASLVDQGTQKRPEPLIIPSEGKVPEHQVPNPAPGVPRLAAAFDAAMNKN